jgi:hypothetical protein
MKIDLNIYLSGLLNSENKMINKKQKDEKKIFLFNKFNLNYS